MGLFKKSKRKAGSKKSLFLGERLDIDGILELENPTASIIELSYGLSDKIAQSGFGSLSSQEKVLHHVYWVETEVNNGGFNQYFFNSSGDYALDTPEALVEIGANHTAEIVRDAIAVFPGGKPPRDRNERDGLFDLVTDEVADKWYECTNRFYEYKDPLGQLQIDYMKANREHISVGE